MAIVLRSESTWRNESGESEMMEVGGSGRKSPRNLLVRPSFIDAFVAYTQVSKGRAHGKKKTLWLRLVMQKYLFQLGYFIQVHCGKIVFVGLVALFMSCLGLKTYQMESDIKKLWIDAGGRLTKELKYTEEALGLDGGELNEAIIQVPEEEGRNVLTVESLFLHLEVLKVIKSVTVDVLDVPWKFQDLCHLIPFSYFDEGNSFNKALQELAPCLIVSPLECFWEGGQIAGPDKPVTILNYGPLNWSNLNPMHILETLGSHLSPTVANGVKDILDKAGITTGYQEKPCLDPNDPACPESAPNFLSKEPPDVASILANGCDGFAKNFIHWNEDIILGGIQRNKSGHLTRARALQSVIFVMGERTLYHTYKGSFVTWNETVAEDVIRTWEKQMTKEVEKYMSYHGNQDRTSTQRTSRHLKSRDKVHSFTSANMAELLADCSQISLVRVALGFLLMACYTILAMVNIKKCDQSQVTIAMSGLFLLVLSSAAGLGLCSVLQLTFNAITTQVVPFLVVGVGMDHVFLILHTSTQVSEDGVPYKERMGACLKRVGGLIFTSTVCNSSAFLLASVIPVPATRFFCLQCCLLILVNGASMLLLFPAIVSIDLMRRKSGRMDFFCCQLRPPTISTVDSPTVTYSKSKRRTSLSSSSPSKRGRWSTSSGADDDVENDDDDDAYELDGFSTFSFKSKSRVTNNKTERGTFKRISDPENLSGKSSGISSMDSSHELLANAAPPSTSSSSSTLSSSSSSSSVYLPSTNTSTLSIGRHNKRKGRRREVRSLFVECILKEFVKRFYGPFLERLPVKIIVVILFIISIVVGIVGVLRVREGLDIMDVVPVSSPEREFLRIQSKYFGFYNFYVATQENFDYSSEHGQQLLHSFHHSFESIGNIIRMKDGSFSKFWLEIFRKWLLDIQEAFDIDMRNDAITKEGFLANCSSLGRLGYKLIIQTGIKMSPIDKNRIYDGRLVTNGIIYTPAFYIYLSAWAHNDIFAYDFSQANIKPVPKPWSHDTNDIYYDIPASHPIVFAQSAFILNDLHSFDTTMNVLTDIRNICNTFSSRGLPNYPHGLVVMFWEQYFSVRFYLFILIAAILCVSFVVILIILLNPFAAFLEVFVLACSMVELYGFMGLTEVKMSALSAVILIVAIGITVHMTVPFVLAFQTCIGPRDRRMILSLEQVVTATTHAFVSAFLGLLVLATTELVFIRRYIFGPFVMLLVIGCFNGLVFLPVLLSLVGPSAEVTPLNDELYLPPPSPVLRPPTITLSSRSRSGQKASYKTRKKSRNGRSGNRSRSRITTRLKNPPNLSTIVEESSNNSCASSISIDLKPTIIISNPPHCCKSGDGSITSQTVVTSDDVRSACATGSDAVVGSLSERGRKFQVPPSSYYLHSSAGSTSVTSSPVQVSSCSSSHCFTTVEATTKVKVHICDQKDRISKYKVPSRHKNLIRKETHESDKQKRTRQS